jgi:hypothetical protein
MWLWKELCPQNARALYRDQDGNFSWKKCSVLSMNDETEKFKVRFELDSSEKDLPRIHICFDTEHPTQFVKRVADAH